MGITKIRWVEELSDMGKCWILFSFLSGLHFCCSNKRFLALENKKVLPTLSLCRQVSQQSFSVLLTTGRLWFSHHISPRIWEPLIGCFPGVDIEQQSVVGFPWLFHRTKESMICTQAQPFSTFFPTSWCKVSRLICRHVVSQWHVSVSASISLFFVSRYNSVARYADYVWFLKFHSLRAVTDQVASLCINIRMKFVNKITDY